MLKYLQDVKTFLESIVSVTKSIVELILNNKAIIILLLVVYSAYYGIKYIAYEMPKKTVEDYYSFVDNKQLDKAWRILTPQFQLRWKDGEKDFRKGYATLTTTKILNVENCNPEGLFEEVNSDKKQVIIDIIVIENFNHAAIFDSVSVVSPQKSNKSSKKKKRKAAGKAAADNKNNTTRIKTTQIKLEQQENILWLKLSDANQFEKLVLDSLPSSKSTMRLVRRFRKVVTIEKNPNAHFVNRLLSDDWMICDIDNSQTAVIKDRIYFYK